MNRRETILQETGKKTVGGHSSESPPVDQRERRPVLPWIGVCVFVSFWMFCLGILVGRGAAPVKFDVKSLQQELANLKKSAIEKTLKEYETVSKKADKRTELEFYEVLKGSKDTPAPPIPPDPPAKSASATASTATPKASPGTTGSTSAKAGSATDPATSGKSTPGNASTAAPKSPGTTAVAPTKVVPGASPMAPQKSVPSPAAPASGKTGPGTPAVSPSKSTLGTPPSVTKTTVPAPQTGGTAVAPTVAQKPVPPKPTGNAAPPTVSGTQKAPAVTTTGGQKPTGETAAAPVPVKTTPEASKKSEKIPKEDSPAGNNYSIQVASVKDTTDADRIATQLKQLGYSVSILSSEVVGKGVWYRLRIGPYHRREEADSVSAKLQRDGFSPITLTSGGTKEQP